MADNNVSEVFEQDDINSNKVMAALSYLGTGILFFLPLVACAKSRFARFHANQSLILLICSIVLNVIIPNILVRFAPTFASILSGVFALFLLVLMILGIVNGAKGKAAKLPVIGGLFTILK